MIIIKKHMNQNLWCPAQRRYISKQQLRLWDRAGVEYRILKPTVKRPKVKRVYVPKPKPIIDECLEPFDADPMTHRKCRACGEPLPTSRYFNHVECRPTGKLLPWDQEDWGVAYGR